MRRDLSAPARLALLKMPSLVARNDSRGLGQVRQTHFTSPSFGWRVLHVDGRAHRLRVLRCSSLHLVNEPGDTEAAAASCL